MKPDPRTIREAMGVGGGVATEEPVASWAGSQILMKDGNAVDAAIATSLALAVVIPHLGGIGGDYFALVRIPEGGVYFLNGSGPAPAGLTLDLLRGQGFEQMPLRSPYSMTVPGLVSGLHMLWKHYGSMEWRELVEPAARLAREGFPVPPSLAKAVNRMWDMLAEDPGSRETYLRYGRLRPGAMVRFPGLAELLEMIAEDPRVFYEGEPAEALASYVQEMGGVLDKRDLEGYSAEAGDPLRYTYRGWRLWEMPPNTQGLTTLHMMSILEQWTLPRSPLDRVYYMLSASRAAYRARDELLGDPRYMDHSPGDLLSENYIEELREEARRGPPECSVLASRETSGKADTTFYTVIDSDGMLVAGIQSLFYPFGSGLTEPRFQIPLNDRAAGFTLREGMPNSLAPGKKPLHTLSAVIAEECEDSYLALGASGGHFRPQQHAYMLTSIIDHGYSVGEAVALPRVLWSPWTCRLVGDPGSSVARIPAGYVLAEGGTGVASAIHRSGERVFVATDPRGDGYPFLV